VAERFADANAIAIIAETGIPKKGAKTAGVQRQYCGARGKIENSVMFAGLVYATGECGTGQLPTPHFHNFGPRLV
jgi:SRSO17 transposase